MGNGEAAAVWRVEMEPSGPTCYPNMRLVATVGGNAACFVDSNTCKPVIKYQEKDEVVKRSEPIHFNFNGTVGLNV